MEKVKINKDTCIGCGACIMIAKENFTFGEETAEVINETVTPEAKEAADSCPVSAIEIVKED